MTVEVGPQGFVIDKEKFYPIGFNYWPRDMAVYMWEEYNPLVIEREMRLISQLGANCIRMFIRWEDLNPEPNWIDQNFFLKFDNFIKIAENNSVKIIPTFLIGHMSGQDWFPEWLLLKDMESKSHAKSQEIKLPQLKNKNVICRDIYEDPLTIDNCKLQIRAFLERYKHSKTIISYDLSNENQYWMMPRTPEIGTKYMKEMYKFMKGIDPFHPITYGMGKPDEPSGFISFGPKSFSKYNDYFSVHVYPVWLYPRTKNIVDFYIGYRPAYECCLAKLSDKPVQLQEFGLSDDFIVQKDKRIRENLLYGYYNVTLWGAIANEVKAGVLTWDFSDFLPELINRNPYSHKNFELKFGVVDHNYELKPSGEAFKRFSQFVKQFRVNNYSLNSAKVGVILPENFNEFPVLREKKSILEPHYENYSKSLFSSFIFLKMSHQPFDYISLSEKKPNLEKYNLLIVPNVYQFSEINEKKLLKYLKEGKNRVIYFSSNVFIPSMIFGESQLETKKISKRRIECAPTEEVKKFFPETLVFKSVRYRSVPEFSNDDISPALLMKNNSNTPIMFYKNFNKSNKAFFLTTPIEINHTRVKNSFQNESGNELYNSLIKYSCIERDLTCENPFLETSILHNKDNDEAIVIVINHTSNTQVSKIKLKRNWVKIREFYNSEFQKIAHNTLEFSISPYANYTFLVVY